jgi:hypothetical protein
MWPGRWTNEKQVRKTSKQKKLDHLYVTLIYMFIHNFITLMHVYHGKQQQCDKIVYKHAYKCDQIWIQVSDQKYFEQCIKVCLVQEKSIVYHVCHISWWQRASGTAQHALFARTWIQLLSMWVCDTYETSAPGCRSLEARNVFRWNWKKLAADQIRCTSG